MATAITVNWCYSTSENYGYTILNSRVINLPSFYKEYKESGRLQ